MQENFLSCIILKNSQVYFDTKDMQYLQLEIQKTMVLKHHVNTVHSIDGKKGVHMQDL